MNRNTAKSKLIDTFKNIPFSELKIGDINNLIDKIYDDFENRTCDNCINASFEIKFGELEFNGCFLVSNENICKWELK